MLQRVNASLVDLRLLRPLRDRDFAVLWAGQTVSRLGDRVYSIVLPLLLLQLGAGAAQLGQAEAFHFRIVRSSSWLLLTIVVFWVLNIFFAGSLSVALPLLARQQLGGASGFGLVLAGMAVGAILSALGLGQRRHLPRRGWLGYGAVALSGVWIALLAFAHNGGVAAALGALLGATDTVFTLVWENSLQELVPAEALGRVASIDLFGSIGLLPAGYLLVGLLVTTTGPVTGMLVCGGGCILLALVALGFHAIRAFQ